MPYPDDSPEDLRARAATCRRVAEQMGADPLARSLIEIAEDYEERAARLAAPAPVMPPQRA